MKKRINLTLTEEVVDWLESNCINKSALVEALLQLKMRQVSTIVDKEIEDAFDGT